VYLSRTGGSANIGSITPITSGVGPYGKSPNSGSPTLYVPKNVNSYPEDILQEKFRKRPDEINMQAQLLLQLLSRQRVKRFDDTTS